MTTLLIGFDAAWSSKNSGALTGIIRTADGTFQELGLPQVASYQQAEEIILEWQNIKKPTTTIILLDQPIIVKNHEGQRPVENLVGSLVSRRYGGVQPANTGKSDMFGQEAPVWGFLETFGGAMNPLDSVANMQVFETYPVLTLIALKWILSDSKRSTGRLPKYNPQVKKNFSSCSWKYVCCKTSRELDGLGLQKLPQWLNELADNNRSRKADQDRLDSCICLLVALHLSQQRTCWMIGTMETGYMIVPKGSSALYDELKIRCESTGRKVTEWVRPFELQA